MFGCSLLQSPSEATLCEYVVPLGFVDPYQICAAMGNVYPTGLPTVNRVYERLTPPGASDRHPYGRRWLQRRGKEQASMKHAIKTPEQLLAFKSLKQVLAAKPPGAHAVWPNASVFAALQLMADKGIGFLIVLDAGKLVGVFSERDYARKVVLQGKASRDTPVQEIMTRKVVSVGLDHTIPQCMALMNEHGFRHLPVIDHGEVIGV
ncbi:MAG: CBS domain-containing protein, partial [Betaproteobacteria bacterium]